MESRELIDRIYYLREKADNNKLAVFVGGCIMQRTGNAKLG